MCERTIRDLRIKANHLLDAKQAVNGVEAIKKVRFIFFSSLVGSFFDHHYNLSFHFLDANVYVDEKYNFFVGTLYNLRFHKLGRMKQFECFVFHMYTLKKVKKNKK